MGKNLKKGKVKFFNKGKKFGFLITNENDLYFRKENLKYDYFEKKEDELCFYTLKYNNKNKKYEAEDVIIIKPLIPQGIYKYLKNENLNDSNILKVDIIENFNLLLNKYALFNGEKFFFYYKDKKGAEYKINTDFSYFDFKCHLKNYKEKLEKLNLEIKFCTFQADWRLIIGLGGESVYETSITLHHIYGFPYIPGQAVKGVVRSYFIKTEFEKTGEKWEQINIFEKVLENFDLEKDERIDYEKFKKKFSIKGEDPSEKLYSYFYQDSNGQTTIEKFQAIFGSQNNQGKIFFFDAYPKTEPKIKIDVMNPHYSDYYGGKKDDKENSIPPADYLSPRPIYFLTVEDTQFEFCLGSKEIYKNYLDEAKNLLLSALQKHGIGAKTSVGYGYMK